VEITIKNGFTREEAEKIIGWNLAGLKSSCMSWGNDQILDNIINQVATQKGCTRAVLDMMEDQGLKEIIQNPHKKTEVSEIIETSINAGIERLENLSLVLVS